MIDKVRKHFDNKHPVINRNINGVDTEISGSDRDVILDTWAEAHIKSFFSNARAERNRRLAESDWTQAIDAPVNAKAWAAYRQALRDLPATIKDPTQPVDWPTPPE